MRRSRGVGSFDERQLVAPVAPRTTIEVSAMNMLIVELLAWVAARPRTSTRQIG